MPEWLFVRMLRFYPCEFQRDYGADALQLIRDRARDEPSVRMQLRLCLDILTDLLAVSLQQMSPAKPLVICDTNSTGRMPSLLLHASSSPRPEFLAAGMVTSTVLFAVFTQMFYPLSPDDLRARLLIPSLFHTRPAQSDSSATQSIDMHSADRQNSSPTKPLKFVARIGLKEGWTMSHKAAVVFLFLALPAVAQAQAFEVISIRPARSGDPREMRMRVLPNGDLHASAVPVLLLLGYAYDVPVNPSPRFSGFPAWRETYDIEAKAPANAVPVGLPELERRRRVQGMIRGLLADRFKLVIRVEQKRMPVYALTVASGGPNLQKSTIAEKDCVFDTSTPESCHHFIVGRGHPLNARAINLDDLALYIENWTDLPVLNRTAVSGLFAVETEGWRPMRLPPPPPGTRGMPHPPGTPAVPFDDLPTIFTVLGKLGLELKPQEATVPVYTVEHIDRPAGH